MRIARPRFHGMLPVDGYGPGFFRIGGEIYRGGVVVLPVGVSSWPNPDDPSPVCEARGSLDLVLVGTGAELVPVSEKFRNELIACGIEVEAMTTPAACRTFNVLLAEGRRVAVAVMPV